MRLANDTLSQEEPQGQNIDLENAISDGDDDKTFAAMGVAKTISTVRLFLLITMILNLCTGNPGRCFYREFSGYFDTGARDCHSDCSVHAGKQASWCVVFFVAFFLVADGGVRPV